MRLLWEESLLGAIGAMIVAATALGMTLLVLEGLFGVDGGVSVIVSLLAAIGVLETIQRRSYAGEEPPVAAVADPAAAVEPSEPELDSLPRAGEHAA